MQRQPIMPAEVCSHARLCLSRPVKLNWPVQQRLALAILVTYTSCRRCQHLLEAAVGQKRQLMACSAHELVAAAPAGRRSQPHYAVKLTKCIVRALKPLRELNPALEDREAFDEVCGICTCILLTVLTLHEPGVCPQFKSLGHLSFHAG